MQIAEQQAANPQSRARPVHGLKPSSQRSIGSDGRAAPSLPPPPTPPTDLVPSHVQQLGAVDLAELAAEGRAGDEAAPPLADEGGVDEARGVVGREAEEELLDQLVHERRRRRHLDWCGGWWGTSDLSWALPLHMHIWTQMGM